MNEQQQSPQHEFLMGVTNADSSIWNWWKIKGDTAEVDIDAAAGCQRVRIFVGEGESAKCVCEMRGPNVGYMQVSHVVPPTAPETAARRDRH